MTVKECIDKLKQFPETLTVKICVEQCDYGTPEDIYRPEYNGKPVKYIYIGEK